MIYVCCDERRRLAVKDHPDLNGIDFVEVSGDQRTLLVHFLKPLAGPPGRGPLAAGQVRIDGGERIRDVAVTGVQAGTGDRAHVLLVEVAPPGDFSTYTLRLVRDARDPGPPGGFDPLLSAVEFSFKVDCPADLDCRTERACPPGPHQEPEINYLAKDYASFRQLMLDRLAVLVPQWRERNPADLGVALVELLAYVGDSLSYHQDAVATEAYLGTARRRVSVRRHARLVDYVMHDGCNARAWVQVRAGADDVPIDRGTQLLTRVPGLGVHIPPRSALLDQALARGPEVFETMEAATRGATRSAACRGGPPAPRSATAPTRPAPTPPTPTGPRACGCVVATCSSSRSGSGRPPAPRRMPTRPAATPSA